MKAGCQYLFYISEFVNSLLYVYRSSVGSCSLSSYLVQRVPIIGARRVCAPAFAI